jgi:Sap, sulfolipid-1-addressing protein
MPAQALALAFAASIYPPAVAAVIALGRGTDVRPRVLAFVLASLLVTYAVGALILYALLELGATGSHHLTPGAGVDIALGVLLVALAVRLHLRRPSPIAVLASRVRSHRRPAEAEERPAEVQELPAEADQDGGSSKIERYLHSRRLAFVLGIVLYVLPSPIYIGAVKSIADANSSTAGELTALIVVVAIMLWMIELPMLMLLAVPDRAASALERINLWFARNGRTLAILAAVAVGIYLIVKGIVQLS